MIDCKSTKAIPCEITDESAENMEPEIPQDFDVRDEGSANWLVRKVVDARSYAERVQNWAALEIRRSENDERFLMHRYGTHLETWAREKLSASANRRRTIALPGGTVGFRTIAMRLSIVDETALLGWCGANLPSASVAEVRATGGEAARLRDWVRQNCPSAAIKLGVVKSVLDDHFRQSGECPSGTECVMGEKFFIR